MLNRPSLAGDERFATNPLRVRHRAALHDAIETVFATMTADAVVERLESAGIACARLNTVSGFLDHPQLAARNVWREIASPAGPLRAMIPPVRIDGVEPVLGPVPALGQHTDAILDELGVPPDTVAAWRAEGAI